MKEIREYLSRRKRFSLTAAGIIGGILANFSGPILMKFAPINYTLAITESILKIAGNLLLASSMAIVLYLSINIARSLGFTWKRIAVIALFCLFSIVLAIMTYKVGAMYNNFVQHIDTLSSESRNEVAKKMTMATTLEKKSKLSYLYAQFHYEERGDCINYFGKDGTEHRYHPNQEAIKNRELLLFFQAFSKMQDKTMMTNIVIWLLSTLIAVCFGFTKKPMIKSSNT